jgi:hypothetical protein
MGWSFTEYEGTEFRSRLLISVSPWLLNSDADITSTGAGVSVVDRAFTLLPVVTISSTIILATDSAGVRHIATMSESVLVTFKNIFIHIVSP